jgi:hypothetical protein
MEIDESDILDEGYYGENKALACLLAADVCFLNIVDISKTYKNKTEPEWTTCVYVNCSDTFAYACADAESITNNDGEADSEIIALYKMWKEHPTYGPVKWCALKRNMRPLKIIEGWMREVNYWDESLEALP